MSHNFHHCGSRAQTETPFLLSRHSPLAPLHSPGQPLIWFLSVRSIHPVEYYLLINRNETLIHATVWLLGQSLSHVWFSVNPWTVAHQAPLSMGFSRQDCWSGLPCPPPGDLPDPGSNLLLLHCRWILYCRATREARNNVDEMWMPFCSPKETRLKRPHITEFHLY